MSGKLKSKMYARFERVIKKHCPEHVAKGILTRVKDVRVVGREELGGLAGSWGDEDREVLVADEQRPDWVLTHEGLHAYVDSASPEPLPEFPVIPDKELFLAWAEAYNKQQYIDDVEDGELSENTEEKWVEDATAFLFPNVEAIKRETPISPAVADVFREFWGRTLRPNSI